MTEPVHHIFTDPTFWLYSWIIVVSFFGVSLFIANWVRMRSATNVYKYVTGLLFGLTLKGSIELYSYILRETGNLQGFIKVIHSPYWDMRLFLTIVPLTALVWKMAYRYFIKRNLNNGQKA